MRHEHLRQYRRYIRYPLTVEFYLSDPEHDLQKGEILFDAVNVSAGGAFLRSGYLLKIGTEFRVCFTLPNRSEPTTASARVAWVTRGSCGKDEPGMGIEFINLSDEQTQAISELLQENHRSND